MKDIINNHPFSPFLKKALLKLGVYHYSLSNSSESIINFKRVIEEFPGSIESTEALEGLKNVYIDIGDISSYFNYVKQLSGVSVNSLAKDSITYQAAEILYLRNDYNKAIQALKEYLNNFPNGIFRLSAHFYKAESLFNTNNFNKALRFLFSNIKDVDIFVASHNEESNYLVLEMMDKYSLKNDSNNIWFCQLYGMGDNITFNLSQKGYNVAKEGMKFDL